MGTESLATGMAAALLCVAGCSAGTPLPVHTYPESPETRTHWELSHRVVGGSGLRVVGQQIGHWDESTSVEVGGDNGDANDDCFVSIAVPGQGGPDNLVGEKLATTFAGRPAVRNGAGAEGDYLMWRLDDDRWVEVSCARPDSRAAITQVAEAVAIRPTAIRVPFDLDVPEGYGASIVEVDLRQPSARVYLGRVGSLPSPPDADLVLMYGTPELSPQPNGEQTTIENRPAVVDEDKRNPAVRVQEQGRWIYVGAYVGDTGPYPDRSGELLLLKTLASSFSPALDLTDPATWPTAENIFG